jgi:hypothetical protein
MFLDFRSQGLHATPPIDQAIVLIPNESKIGTSLYFAIELLKYSFVRSRSILQPKLGASTVDAVKSWKIGFVVSYNPTDRLIEWFEAVVILPVLLRTDGLLHSRYRGVVDTDDFGDIIAGFQGLMT